MSEKKVHIQYFAIFREQAKVDSEEFQTSAVSAVELYQELSEKYGFTLGSKHVRVAVNDDFCPMDYAIKPNDRLVFIPPVSGG